MVSYLLKAGVGSAAMPEDVLPMCPYHNQIIFAKAARDAYIEQNGLYDFEQFGVRNDIVHSQKSVGVEEVIYREDMRQFFTGAGRLVNVAIDTVELLNMIRHSENWGRAWNQVKQMDLQVLMMSAFATYGRVKMLLEQENFEQAGQALATGLFPNKQTMSGSLDWPRLPYAPSHDGEEVAGYLAGLIYGFTSEESYDNLASCVISQDTFLDSWTQATDSLMARHNDDVATAVAHTHATILGLDSLVAECSEETRSQVQRIQEQVQAEGEPIEEAILANLLENKNHVELEMAKMKMHEAMHNYLDYGVAFTDIFLTIAAPRSI